MRRPNLFRCNTPAAISRSESRAEALHQTVGLYNTKAKNSSDCAAAARTHGGETAGRPRSLEALPGVGRKTASIILNMVFGQVEIAVDTHIFASPIAPDLHRASARRVETPCSPNTPPQFQKRRTPLVAAARPLRVHGRAHRPAPRASSGSVRVSHKTRRARRGRASRRVGRVLFAGRALNLSAVSAAAVTSA